MVRPPSKPRVCGKLAQSTAYSPVDVCRDAAGHTGPHHGRYRGMVWEYRRDPKTRTVSRTPTIISHGGTTVASEPESTAPHVRPPDGGRTP